MQYGSLVLEKKDFVMIKRYLHLNRYIEDYAHKDVLDTLVENMATALICDEEDMPDDVVRLYSYVQVSSPSGWLETVQLVLPYEDDIAKDNISVQSPLGASLIGRSEGDRIQYGLPFDILSLKIKNVSPGKKHTEKDISETVLKKDVNDKSKNSLTLNI